MIFGQGRESRRGDDVEIYFDTEEIEEVCSNLKKKNVEFIPDLREQPWSQRVFRIYDPDHFIVEIGGPMTTVVLRLNAGGLSKDEIVKRTSLPCEIFRQIIS